MVNVLVCVERISEVALLFLAYFGKLLVALQVAMSITFCLMITEDSMACSGNSNIWDIKATSGKLDGANEIWFDEPSSTPVVSVEKIDGFSLTSDGYLSKVKCFPHETSLYIICIQLNGSLMFRACLSSVSGKNESGSQGSKV